jgi:DNA-binding transcriptional ArsR family regulator
MANETEELSRLLKVLSVGTRLRIVQILKGRVLCMGALASQLEVTQGAVSQHLRVMREAGLLVAKKRGYFVHYHLNERTLRKWSDQINTLLTPSPVTNRRCTRRVDGKHKD